MAGGIPPKAVIILHFEICILHLLDIEMWNKKITHLVGELFFYIFMLFKIFVCLRLRVRKICPVRRHFRILAVRCLR